MDDINILEVDEKIRGAFEESKNKIKEYMESLKEIEELLANSNMENIIGKQMKQLLEQKAKELRETIDSIVTNKEYGYYILQSFQIIDKYKEEIQKPVEVLFGSKNNKKIDCKDTIKSYIDMASELCNLFGIENTGKPPTVPEKKTKRIRRSKDSNTKKQKKKILQCKNCKSKNLEIICENGYICQECFLQVDPVIIKVNTEKINVNVNKYQELDNFRTLMKQYQGKEDVEIKPEVLDFVRTKLANESKITKKHVYNVLVKSKYEYYRKHSTFIWTQITGKSAPDLSDVEHLLEEDYKAYINMYNTRKSRTNALNTQCIFYQLLMKHKVKVDKSDFNFLKDDRLEQYNEISRSIFDSLGWNYIPIY